MRFGTKLPAAECLHRLRDGMDSRFLVGQERRTGWVLGPVFSVEYFSGRGVGRWKYPISNKAMGVVLGRDERAVVKAVFFRGATDPLTAAAVFLMGWLLFGLVGGATGAPPLLPPLLAAVWTAAVGLLTFLCAALTREGRECRRKLEVYLRELLRAEQEE